MGGAAGMAPRRIRLSFVFPGAAIHAVRLGAQIRVPQATSLTYNSADARAVEGPRVLFGD
jgi:hypothetical protein